MGWTQSWLDQTWRIAFMPMTATTEWLKFYFNGQCSCGRNRSFIVSICKQKLMSNVTIFRPASVKYDTLAWHDLIHDFLPQTYVEPVDTLPFPSVHSWPDVDTSCLSIKGVSLRKQWAQQRHYDCSVRIAVTVQADTWLSVFEHKTHCISLSIKGLISGQRRNRTWSWRLSKSQAWVFDLTIIKSKYKGELCLTRLFYIFRRLP